MSAQASGKTRFMAHIGASALAAAAIAGSALGAAPAANASCASFFSIGNSADCTSTLTSVAFAIGPGAQARATGVFGAAFSIGDGAVAKASGLLNLASATGTKSNAEAKGTFGAAMTAGAFSLVQTEDLFTVAAALGDNTLALGKGVVGIAAVLGPYSYAGTDGDPARGKLGFNVAVNVSPTNKSVNTYQASGIGNVAVNLFGVNDDLNGKFSYAAGLGNVVGNVGGNRNELTAYGVLNNATNVLGSRTKVTATSSSITSLGLNAAFSVLGSNNTVYAGPGPVAIAGSIAQTNKLISKQKPGININGIRIPNTAAATKPVPKSAAGESAKPAGPKAAAAERAKPNSR